MKSVTRSPHHKGNPESALNCTPGFHPSMSSTEEIEDQSCEEEEPSTSDKPLHKLSLYPAMGGKKPKAQSRKESPSVQTRSGKNVIKCVLQTCPGGNNEKLKCYDCKDEYHYDCANISFSLYKCITEAAEVGARWHCTTCLKSASSPSRSTLQGNFENFKISMHEELKAISANVEKQLMSFKAQILDKQETCQKSYASAISKNLDKQHSETAQVVVELKKNVETLNNNVENEKIQKNEIKMRERKKNNLMMFKLPESPNQSPAEAFKEDFVNIMNIIDPKKSLSSTDVIDVFRIGEKDASKTRPVVIRFSSTEKRNEMLQLRNLYCKTKDNSSKVQVFLAPDRTNKQIQEHKLLVDELNRRRNVEGETDIQIRNGKIMKRDQPFRFKPQDYWGCRAEHTADVTDSTAITTTQ